jgi:hypothetical protein
MRMNNLDALMSPYGEATQPGAAPLDVLEPRHRADGPAELGDDAWASGLRPRHRADWLTGS